MIARRITRELKERIDTSPAVALLGPRQAGKTTLALELAGEIEAVYLDLESEADRAKLGEPELYLEGHLDKLVILDEVHRMPGLFPVLRSLIDRARRRGRRVGLYLLLGSASLDLLRHSGESLAGRISYLELAPFDVLEVAPEGGEAMERLWLRGGFPESFLAQSERQSLQWRRDFIRTYLERELPLFGARVPAETLRRFWTMLAHLQGEPLNLSLLARNLELDVRTVDRYIDLLADLYLLRRLPAWHRNVKKRLVKTPKVYVRDSGLVHALLGITDLEALLGHPVLGKSWEGFVVENLLVVASPEVEGYHYRSAGGAEIDLILRFPEGALWAVEIKRSLDPRPRRGFHEACRVIEPEARFVVYPGKERFPLGGGVWAVPLPELARQVAERSR